MQKKAQTVKINRILIDCSDTYIENLNTGIQRVVRNIVSRSAIITEVSGAEVIPVILDKKRGYVKLKDIRIRNGNKNISKNAKNITKKLPFKVFLKLIQHTVRKFKHYLEGLLQIFNAKFYTDADSVIPEENDALILADGFWNYRYNVYFDNFCKKIKKNKGKVIAVIYDIIPLTNPEFFNIDLTLNFKGKIKKIKSFIDAVVTISKSEKEIIEGYLKKTFNFENIGNKPVKYFYPGCDIKCGIDFANISKYQDGRENDAAFGGEDGLNLKKIRIRKNLTEIFEMPDIHIQRRFSYISVGTIEPRKGYDYTIEAFEKMWESGYGGILVIAGKIGWKTEKLLKKISSSPYLNKKLFMFNDLNDGELCYMYEAADALVSASFREGYGLPLAEAINYRLPVLASDIPVFREIGSSMGIGKSAESGKSNGIIYFNPDKNGLISAVKEFENRARTHRDENNPNTAAEVAAVVSWDESVRSFSSAVVEICGIF